LTEAYPGSSVRAGRGFGMFKFPCDPEFLDGFRRGERGVLTKVYSEYGAIVPTFGTGYWLSDRSALNLEIDVTALIYRRDGEYALTLHPAAYLGFAVQP
jgi:hypothetical protein